MPRSSDNPYARVQLAETEFMRSIPYIKITEKIGKGGFGDVWVGNYERKHLITEPSAIDTVSNAIYARQSSTKSSVPVVAKTLDNSYENSQNTTVCYSGMAPGQNSNTLSPNSAQAVTINPGASIPSRLTSIEPSTLSTNNESTLVQSNSISNSQDLTPCNSICQSTNTHLNSQVDVDIDVDGDVDVLSSSTTISNSPPQGKIVVDPSVAINSSNFGQVAHNQVNQCTSEPVDNGSMQDQGQGQVPTGRHQPNPGYLLTTEITQDIATQQRVLIHREEVAVKRMAFSTKNVESVNKRLRYLHRELTLLKVLKTYANKDDPDYTPHASVYNNIIMDLKNTFIVQNMVSEQCFIYQITERFHTDLRVSKWKILTECTPADLKYIMYKTILGLDFIHHLGIVHRDISPDNIFLNWQDGNSRPTRIVISDFGQARFYIEYKCSTLPERYARTRAISRQKASLTHPHLIGKIHFRPPEGLAYYTANYYLQSWDIWQVGVVFLNMISQNKHPFVQEDSDYEMLVRPAHHQTGANGITNDTYMLGLIEKHIGYPSEKEMRDLVFFYPKEDNHSTRISRQEISRIQLEHHNERNEYFTKLLAAFQRSFKCTEFNRARYKEGKDLDLYRLNKITQGNKRHNFISGDFGNDCLKFIMPMIRYSPTNRPKIRKLMVDEFFGNRDYVIPLDELPKKKALFQEQLINVGHQGLDSLKKFTSDYITKWGFIKLVKNTRGFPGIIIMDLLKVLWVMAEELPSPIAIPPQTGSEVLQVEINRRITPVNLRAHVYQNDPNSQLTICGESYVVFHVDIYIIIIENGNVTV